MIVDKLVVAVVRQLWLERNDNSLYEAIVTAVYRLRDGKVCELWALADRPFTTYQEQNKNFERSYQLFKLSEKRKRGFISRLNLSEIALKNHALPLSEIEKECLYYYINGFSAKETANILKLSSRTVETHIAHIKNKFKCHSKNELREKLFVI